jgi:hypothetical protein
MYGGAEPPLQEHTSLSVSWGMGHAPHTAAPVTLAPQVSSGICDHSLGYQQGQCSGAGEGGLGCVMDPGDRREAVLEALKWSWEGYK